MSALGQKRTNHRRLKYKFVRYTPITDIDTPTAVLSRPAVRVCLSLAIYPELKNKTLVGQVRATNANSVLAVAKRPRTPPFVTAPRWKFAKFLVSNMRGHKQVHSQADDHFPV